MTVFIELFVFSYCSVINTSACNVQYSNKTDKIPVDRCYKISVLHFPAHCASVYFFTWACLPNTCEPEQ